MAAAVLLVAVIPRPALGPTPEPAHALRNAIPSAEEGAPRKVASVARRPVREPMEATLPARYIDDAVRDRAARAVERALILDSLMQDALAGSTQG
jgi:hypothetical protein